MALPVRELRFLVIAVFLLFGTAGFITDAGLSGRLPVAAVALIAIASGCVSVLYVMAFARRPSLVPAVIVIQIVVNISLSHITANMAHSGRFVSPSTEWGLPFAVTGIWVMVLGSYGFFLAFIQTSGRRALRAQRELELAQGIQATLVPPISYRDERFEVYALTLPSDKVGGDVVDIVKQDGVFSCIVADVSGHGLQAGILMGMVKTASRTLLLDGCRLVNMLEKLNRVLPDVKEERMYTTFAGIGSAKVMRLSMLWQDIRRCFTGGQQQET
jgi:hypothetical protein